VGVAVAAGCSNAAVSPPSEALGCGVNWERSTVGEVARRQHPLVRTARAIKVKGRESFLLIA